MTKAARRPPTRSISLSTTSDLRPASCHARVPRPPGHICVLSAKQKGQQSRTRHENVGGGVGRRQSCRDRPWTGPLGGARPVPSATSDTGRRTRPGLRIIGEPLHEGDLYAVVRSHGRCTGCTARRSRALRAHRPSHLVSGSRADRTSLISDAGVRALLLVSRLSADAPRDSGDERDTDRSVISDARHDRALHSNTWTHDRITVRIALA